MKKSNFAIFIEYLPWLIINVFWAIFFWVVFWKMMYVADGRLWAAHEHVWSDWALHLGIANIFALKPVNEWFAYHPIFAAGKFTYPFAANLISGLLMRFGWSMESAFFWPSWITAMILTNGLYVFYKSLLKNKIISAILVFVFYCGYGLNFFGYIYQSWIDHSSFKWIGDVYYSRIEEAQWYSGNPLVGLLIPQRAFLLGMAVAIWVLSVLLYVMKKKKFDIKSRIILLMIGLLASLLVVTHPHSLIALAVITAGWFLIDYKNWQRWLFFLLPFGLLSILLYAIFILGGIQNSAFMSLSLGWTLHNLVDWLWFWLKAWGLVLPLSAIGLILMYQKKNKGINIVWPFIFLFVMANIVLFQPVAWDNSKIFLWSYFGLLVIVGYVLKVIWRRKRIMLLVLVIFLLIAGGGLDLFKLWNSKKFPIEMAGAEEVAMAEFIKNNTGTQDLVLTTTNHNNLVMMLAARPVLLGYTAWAWNYGFDYRQTESDIRAMYEKPLDNLALFDKYKIKYILIGPYERNAYQIDQQYFDNNLESLYLQENHILYKWDEKNIKKINLK